MRMAFFSVPTSEQDGVVFRIILRFIHITSLR